MPTLEAALAQATLAPTVELTRAVRSPRRRVYEAWTNPELLRQFFGPENMHCTSAALDARVGGAYSIGVRPNGAPATQPDSIASGNYTQVVDSELLQFTWKPTWNPVEESLVTVSFRDAAGEGTEITIRHESFAQEAIEGYTKGWTACLDKMETALVAPADYARTIRIDAPRERVFAALSTPQGVEKWWIRATGSGAAGGDLNLHFAGMEEPFVLHVDEATAPSAVHWTSRLHSVLPEWDGTKILFDLVERTAETCELHFRHVGLSPKLACYEMCESGWNRYLPSLVSYAERGEGMPYRKPAPTV
ncbi:MAG: SRPBCC domain-containing protein [Acidobacteriota bacterium]|nr:SRPBCC domain-containing protein [Acidobacteriota bacterium]